jgi:hypothetical protein
LPPTIPINPIASSRSRTIALLAALFIFLFAAYALTTSADLQANGDTALRINVAEEYMQGHVDLPGWILQFPHHFKKEWIDPRIWYCFGNHADVCSTYLPGQPLVIIPFDYLGQQVASHERWPLGPTVITFDHLVGPLFGALLGMIFFMFAVRLGYGRLQSLVLTAILAFATTVWPDEQSVSEHIEVTFFIFLAMYLIFRLREQAAPEVYAVLAGLAAGGAVLTRYQDAFLGLAAIGLYLVLPGPRAGSLVRRAVRLALLGAGVMPSVIVVGWYDWYRFGSVFASGHQERIFGYPPLLGAAGLLFSPGKGLVWYAPTVWLALVAAPRFARRFPALLVAFGALCVVFVGLYANVTYWFGDPAWGPRYLFILIPFLTLPLGELLRRARFARLLWLLTALVVFAGFTVQLAGVSVSQWRSWYRVISYEEAQGQKWEWIASRYHYFWNVHESPLNFQIHGLYQLGYDSLANSRKYELVPPPEDPVLDDLTTTYNINQWNLWWASNEYNWWMGRDKVVLGVLALLALMGATGLYLVAETSGIFAEQVSAESYQPLPEAA